MERLLLVYNRKRRVPHFLHIYNNMRNHPALKPGMTRFVIVTKMSR